MQKEPTKITIAQAAIILNVHPNTIRKFIKSGHLTKYTLPEGTKVYLCEEEVRGLFQKTPLYG